MAAPSGEIVCEDGVCRIVGEESGPGGPPLLEERFPGYEVVANGMGERSPEEMVALLEGREPMRERTLWEWFLVAFLGGILLNLTPCVLPLIPVTLMILGSGPGGPPFRRSAAYGLGITVAYGALGVVCLAAGTAFGTLQASPWFSAVVAVVMVTLALAMFGVFSVDFSRFRKRSGPGGPPSPAGVVAAFGAGVGFALLAGACVAPVVLETLVAAMSWQARGVRLAWALPFALGLGMGAPWMALGAGMRRWMPKPGRWMVWIERGFGVVAIAFAVHYARLAWSGFRGSVGTVTQGDGLSWVTDADEAFLQAELDGKPIFVDLWATWCRSCEAMEQGTLRDARVQKALAECVPLRLQCEDPNAPEAVALFHELGFTQLRGLPAYALLRKRIEPHDDTP